MTDTTGRSGNTWTNDVSSDATIAGVIQGMHARSPKATEFVVGYPDILPQSGTSSRRAGTAIRPCHSRRDLSPPRPAGEAEMAKLVEAAASSKGL